MSESSCCRSSSSSWLCHPARSETDLTSLATEIAVQEDSSSRIRSGLRHPDAVGLILVTAFTVWISVAAGLTKTSPGPVIALVGAAVATYVIVRAASVAGPLLVPVVVVVAIGVAIGSHEDAVLSGAPLAGPLGYANANAALALQGAIAGTMVIFATRIVWVRVVAALASLALVAVAIGSGSETVLFLLAVLGPATLLAGLRRAARALAVGLLAAVVVVVGVTIAAGIAHERGDREAWVKDLSQVVTMRRVDLWRDAWVLMRDQPIRGVGIDRFQRTSPTALSDADAAWAHEEFLQIGAEAGAPAMILLVVLFGWAIWRATRTTTADALTLLALLAVAALAIHSSVDYVLHFPAVPITAVAVFASGVNSNRR